MSYIVPDWPAPVGVKALCTTRQGGDSKGHSQAPFDHFNLALHVGDSESAVLANRDQLMRELALTSSPRWLSQVHGCDVALTGADVQGCSDVVPLEADASVSREAGEVLAIMTADCLPVLLCDRHGQTIGAAHAGWRGLCHGVIENTVEAMGVVPDQLMAWLGPAIGPEVFEVGDEVREAFMAADRQAAICFREGQEPGKWFADLYQLARQRLQAIGVTQVSGGEYCTLSQAELFYSYRRERHTGRMASLIWIEPSRL